MHTAPPPPPCYKLSKTNQKHIFQVKEYLKKAIRLAQSLTVSQFPIVERLNFLPAHPLDKVPMYHSVSTKTQTEKALSLSRYKLLVFYFSFLHVSVEICKWFHQSNLHISVSYRCLTHCPVMFHILQISCLEYHQILFPCYTTRTISVTDVFLSVLVLSHWLKSPKLEVSRHCKQFEELGYIIFSAIQQVQSFVFVRVLSKANKQKKKIPKSPNGNIYHAWFS